MRAFLVACIFAVSMLPQSSVYASDNLYDVENVASEPVASQSMDVTTVQELLKTQASEPVNRKSLSRCHLIDGILSRLRNINYAV